MANKKKPKKHPPVKKRPGETYADVLACVIGAIRWCVKQYRIMRRAWRDICDEAEEVWPDDGEYFDTRD